MGSNSTPISLDSKIKMYTHLTNKNNQDTISNYFYLESQNPKNYINTNSTGLKNIVNSTNNNLSIYTLGANQLNSLNNINNEAIIKKDQLLTLENNDLSQQLLQLENLQSTISNKNSMINQMYKNIEDNNNNIKLLSIVLFLGFILLLLIIAHGSKSISQSILIVSFSGIVFLFLLSYVYLKNMFYFSDAIHGIFSNNDLRLNNLIHDFEKDIKKNIDKEINKNLDTLKNNYISDYCGCSSPGILSTEKESDGISSTGDNLMSSGSSGSSSSSSTNPPPTSNIPNNDTNISPSNNIFILENNKVNDEEGLANYNYNYNPGYFYYDGSSPQQLLSPNPEIYDKNNSTKLQGIDWLDYSGNGNIEFNPNFDKKNYDISYTNTNLYNKETTDLSILQKNTLNSVKSYLMDNKTVTLNQ